jgi:hypothetical protein
LVDGYDNATAPYDLVIEAPIIQQSIVVDNLDAGFEATGSWSESGAVDEYAGSSQYSLATGSTARWTPNIPTAGTYEVYAWWSALRSSGAYDRDSAADYTIVYDGGSETVIKDQDVDSGQWNLLGTYSFAAGTGGYVELVRDTNNGANGTCADAVQFVRTVPATPELLVSPTSLTASGGSSGSFTPAEANLYFPSLDPSSSVEEPYALQAADLESSHDSVLAGYADGLKSDSDRLPSDDLGLAYWIVDIDRIAADSSNSTVRKQEVDMVDILIANGDW